MGKNTSTLYAIYLRKSRADVEAEQRGEGETLARHRAALLELAAARGCAIGQQYREIVSGDTIAARPVMQQLLADVEAGRWQGVLVVEVERLARGDSIDQGIVAQTFKYSDTLIITPAKTYDPSNDMDEEYFEFGLFMARREYKAISRRLLAGRVASIKEGKYMGTRPVFGYRRAKLQGEKGWTMEPIPEEAAAVRMAFSLYLHGEAGRSIGANEIANRVNAMGCRTFSGRPFDANRIRKMLTNPAYIGMVQWNQRTTVPSMQGGVKVHTRPKCSTPLIVQGRHPAIIDRETYDAVQAIFSARQKPPAHTDLPIRNPLNGLIHCGECGRAIVLSPAYRVNKAGVRAEPYYRCSNVHCSCSRINQHYVIDALLDTLERWITLAASPAPTAPEAPTSADDTRAQITKQLATLRTQQDRLRDLLEQGVYSVETYVERNAILQQRLADTEVELAHIPAPLPSLIDTIRAVAPHVRSVLDAFASAPSPEAQNAILRTVVSSIVYHKTGRAYRGQDASQYMRLDVYPVGWHEKK